MSNKRNLIKIDWGVAAEIIESKGHKDLLTSTLRRHEKFAILINPSQCYIYTLIWSFNTTFHGLCDDILDL